MSGVFEHSIKVPRLYKTVAKIVQTVREDGASLKQLVYLKKHPNIKALYALALTCLQHGFQLDQLIRRTKILFNEPRLDPWLARILITELLWGKKHLSSECKPIRTVISYEKLLNEELKNIGDFDLPENKFKVEKPRYVRVNTLTMSVEEAISSFEEEGWRPLYRSKNYTEFIEAVSNLSGRAFIQDIHVPELLVFPPKTRFYNHPAYTSGAIILQDKASCLPAYLLDARPGSTVLDMCASPGMKTTHLAAMLQNRGKIYAVEIDKRRYETLCEIVQSTNSYCVETINADVMTLNAEKCPGVEYILVDPSCSGSGMLDRLEVEGSSNDKCAPGRLRNLQSFQVIILRHALLNFPTAKRVVYSTCSIYTEENEKVVDDVLSQVGDSYKLISAKTLMNNNWLNYSSTEFICGDNCLYARSETDLSNGFFVAVFERNFDVPLPEIKRKKKEQKTEGMNGGNNLGDGNEEGGEVNEKKKKKQEKKRGELNGEDHFGSGNERSEELTEKKREKERENLNGENNIGDGNEESEELNERKNKKKKKKKKKKGDNATEENIDKNSIEANVEADETLEIAKCDRNAKFITKDDDESLKNDNNCSEIIATKRKKSKRKYDNNDAVETARDNDENICENNGEDSSSLKKKKKCKKSRNEPEDQDSIKVIDDNEEELSRKKKKSKKSKRNNEIVEIGGEINENSNQETAGNVEETIIPKKRKKKNK